jgi:hypothetical protein
LEKPASTLNTLSVFLLLAIGSKEDRFLDIERSGANRFGESYREFFFNAEVKQVFFYYGI